MDLGRVCEGPEVVVAEDETRPAAAVDEGVEERRSGGVTVRFFAMCSTRAEARAGSFLFFSMIASYKCRL